MGNAFSTRASAPTPDTMGISDSAAPPASATGNSSASTAAPPAAATGNSASASAAAPTPAAIGNSAPASASAPTPAANGNSASTCASAPTPAVIKNSAPPSAAADPDPSPAAIRNSASTCVAAPTRAAVGASASASAAMAVPASSNLRSLIHASTAREDPVSSDLRSMIHSSTGREDPASSDPHPVIPASAGMADPLSSSNLSKVMQAVTAKDDPASSNLRPVLVPASRAMADPSSFSNLSSVMQDVTARDDPASSKLRPVLVPASTAMADSTTTSSSNPGSLMQAMEDPALRPAPLASRAMAEAATTALPASYIRPAVLLPSLPDDVELLRLLGHYVASGGGLPSWIPVVDVYDDQPALLTAAHPHVMAANGSIAWYFVSAVQAKTEHSKRKNRVVSSGDGFWKSERKADCVESFDQASNSTILGWNLSLSYMKNEGGDKSRVGFLMNELTHGGPEVPDQLAICRVYKSTWGKNKKKKKLDVRARSEAPAELTRTSDQGSSALPCDATAAAAAAATSVRLPVLPMAAWRTPPAPTPYTLSQSQSAGPTAALAAAAKGNQRSTTKRLRVAAANAAVAVAAGTTGQQPSWCSPDAMALFAKERQRVAANPSLAPAATEVPGSSQRQWISIQIDADDSSPSAGNQNFSTRVYGTRVPDDEPGTQTTSKKRKLVDCQGWLMLETGAKKACGSPGLTA